MEEGLGLGMVSRPRAGVMRNGETVVEVEMEEDGMILGNRETQ